MEIDTKTTALDLLAESEALLTGHFLLSSGLHADRYFQCARAFVDPTVGTRLVAMLVDRLPKQAFDYVVGPALGGVIVAYELARQLAVRTCFTERENGTMRLRRGFALPRAARVVIAEDVVTTGKSSQETINVLTGGGARVLGVACLVDRSSGTATATLGLPVWSVVQAEVPTWAAAECPLCQAGSVAIKPGSRP